MTLPSWRTTGSIHGRITIKIKLTTGKLLSAAAEAGGILGGLAPRETRHLAAFGTQYGLALQISDDISDIENGVEVSGKSQYVDILEGRCRLPLLLALARSSTRVKRAFRKELNEIRATPSSDLAAKIASRVIKSGALSQCRGIAKKHVENSLGHLKLLQPSYAVSMLEQLARDIDELLRSEKDGT